MDVLNSLEIYIPEEAEVKNIPLWSLPNSVLRRMGLPQFNASRKLADSPEGIWICPAVVRKKGQKPTSRTGSAVENMSSVLGTDLRAVRGPFRMSFVSSNRAAYKVLRDTMPRAPTSQVAPMPQDSAPRTNQDAVVIYRGQVYLSIRMRNRCQGQPDAGGPQTAMPSTSHVPTKKQKKEPLNDSKPKKKQNTCKAAHRENKEEDARKRDVHPLSQSAESEREFDSPCPQDSRGQQVSGVALKPCCFEPHGEQEEVVNSDSGEREMQDPRGEEAPSAHESSDADGNLQMDIGEVDPSGQGRIEPLGAAVAPTSLQMKCDFNELEKEERIAQMRARLKQKEAAFNNLLS